MEKKGLVDEAGKIAQPQGKVLEGSGAAWPPPFRHGSDVGGFLHRKLPPRPQGLGGRGLPAQEGGGLIGRSKAGPGRGQI